MYPVGGYPAMPSPVEIRKLYAGTEAESASASAIESNKAAREIVDDVNFVHYEMRRLDGTEFDTDGEKGRVSVDAQPKKANFFQKMTGIGLSSVDEIASHKKSKDEVSSVEGTLSDKEMDVTVNYAGNDEALIYSKVEAEDGTVFFQRGSESVGIDKNGLLVMQEV
jgi:hypothetical protein